MPEYKVTKSPISLTAQRTLVLIASGIDTHCFALWCSCGIKAGTITSLMLTTTWKSFLFDLDYNIRAHFSPISDTGLYLLLIGCVGGCWLSHFYEG